jgi:ATP-dependent DNA helicase DinG
MVAALEVYARGSETSVAAPAEFCERGDVVIHNHPSGVLQPSDADVAVAAGLAEVGIASALVDNDVTAVYFLVEPFPPEEIVQLDADEMADHISDGGSVSALLDGFLERPSQISMLRAVVAGFNDDGIVVAEAGTGVGKSLAYLVPAVAWAAANRERIVIATGTINLQQQLVEKDVMTVQRALGTSVKVALVKGRGNYICPRRIEEQNEEASLFNDNETLHAISEWVETTSTGSRSDLPFFVPDDLWGRINSEADTCSPARCPNRDRCFVMAARRRAAGAQILVANHHLVFSDLAVRRAGAGWEGTAVLPAFQRVIFDEAHNLERGATSFFSDTVSVHSMNRQLGRVLRRRGPRRFGLLERMPGLGADGSLLARVETEIDGTRKQAETLNEELVRFMGDESAWRLTADTTERFRRELSPLLADTSLSLGTLAAVMTTLSRSIDDVYREDPSFLQWVAITRRLQTIAGVIDRFREGEHDDQSVFWLDLRRDSRGRSWVSVVITPLDLRDLMAESLFGPYQTVVLTSATLAVNGLFDFWANRIGVPLEDVRTVAGQYPSPFDYRKRVLLAVPSDAPFPDDQRYNDFLKLFVQRVVNASRGGALILFTSYRQMTEIFDATAEILESRGYPCIRQGTDDRGKLLDRFRDDPTGVLFATDSFWEGIDAPGDTLRLVVVCRLPFRVPTDPVQKARAEAVEEQGGNSFADFSLPQAVTRLKQGFGRLMRRSDDYGVVIVTDPRMIRKSYGRVFWNSLPPARPLVGDSESIVEEVAGHIGRMARF